MGSRGDASGVEQKEAEEREFQDRLIDRLLGHHLQLNPGFQEGEAADRLTLRQKLRALIDRFQVGEGRAEGGYQDILDLRRFGAESALDDDQTRQFYQFVYPLFQPQINQDPELEEEPAEWRKIVNHYGRIHGSHPVFVGAQTLTTKLQSGELSQQEWLTDADLSKAKMELTKAHVNLFPGGQDVLHVTTPDRMKELLRDLTNARTNEAHAHHPGRTVHHLLINNGADGSAGTHWTRAKVTIEDENRIRIQYNDSLGDDAENTKKNAVEERIRETLNRQDGEEAELPYALGRVEANFSGEQSAAGDGWSCGYRAFYGALSEMATQEGEACLSADSKEALNQYLGRQFAPQAAAEDGEEDDEEERARFRIPVGDSGALKNSFYTLALGDGWDETLTATREQKLTREREEAQQQQKLELKRRQAHAVLGGVIALADRALEGESKTRIDEILGAPRAIKIGGKVMNAYAYDSVILKGPTAADKKSKTPDFQTKLEVSTNGVQVPRSAPVPNSAAHLDKLAETMVKAYVFSQGGSFQADGTLDPAKPIRPVVLEANNEALGRAIMIKLAELNVPYNDKGFPASLTPGDTTPPPSPMS